VFNDTIKLLEKRIEELAKINKDQDPDGLSVFPEALSVSLKNGATPTHP
jgi:hypothetical protein